MYLKKRSSLNVVTVKGLLTTHALLSACPNLSSPWSTNSGKLWLDALSARWDPEHNLICLSVSLSSLSSSPQHFPVCNLPSLQKNWIFLNKVWWWQLRPDGDLTRKQNPPRGDKCQMRWQVSSKMSSQPASKRSKIKEQIQVSINIYNFYHHHEYFQ